MNNNVYATIFDLEEIIFIGGTTYEIDFIVTDETGTPIDLSASTCTWDLAYYGNPETSILHKDGTVYGVDSDRFKINLTTDDTKDLYGDFIQQPVVVDFSGREFRLGQGIITILQRINN